METVVCMCSPAVAISGIRKGPAITPSSTQLYDNGLTQKRLVLSSLILH